MRYLVEDRGADISAKNKYGNTSLHFAAQGGFLDVVKYLLGKRSIDNLQDNNGDTALHWAALNGRLDVVKYLLGERSVGINPQGNNGATIIADMVGYLLGEHSADLNLGNNSGEKALHFAAENWRLNVVQYLVGKGVDINSADYNGYTALHKVAEYDHLEVASYLLSQGANISLKTNEGLTAQSYAQANGYIGIVELLENWGKGVGAADLSHNYNAEAEVDTLSRKRSLQHEEGAKAETAPTMPSWKRRVSSGSQEPSPDSPAR